MAETTQQPKWTDVSCVGVKGPSGAAAHVEILNTGVETWEVIDSCGPKSGHGAPNDTVTIESAGGRTLVMDSSDPDATQCRVATRSGQPVRWAPGEEISFTNLNTATCDIGIIYMTVKKV